MITFKKLTYSNFLSAGTQPIEIDFTKSSSTLIIGANGAGKSSLVDALVFALYGKPFRKINKPQLINSVNEKNCLVELSFTRGEDAYIIKRGIQPNLFEVSRNGKNLNHDAAVKDFQKKFENDHLRINYRSFCQVVILGSASYVPFMKLNPSQRREVIEDLLDIQILAKMNYKLKEKKGTISSRKKDLQASLTVLESEINSARKNYESLLEKDEKLKAVKEKEILDLDIIISNIKIDEEKQRKKLESVKTTLKKETEKIDHEIRQTNDSIAIAKNTIADLAKQKSFYENNDECPSCKTQMDDDHKQTHVDKIDENSKLQETSLNSSEAILLSLNNSRKKYTKIEKAVGIEERNHARILSEISMHQNNKTKAQSEIADIEKSISNLATIQDDISSKEKDYVDHEKRFKACEMGLEYYTGAQSILKDDGVRSRILLHYVPILNDRVNHYLEVLDFFASFHLDENFKETIKARHRDEFSYDSFSEGEKQRVSLSLLFAWRDLAKMKNSLSTNLLILDETFDSSLDADGVENLMMIFSSLDTTTNVHVISHKVDLLDDRFERTLMFDKDGNFSAVTEK